MGWWKTQVIEDTFIAYGRFPLLSFTILRPVVTKQLARREMPTMFESTTSARNLRPLVVTPATIPIVLNVY